MALMSIEWEFKYPVVSLQVKDRGVSDHTPHLLDMREHQPFKAKGKQFRIELSWFTMRILMIMLLRYGIDRRLEQ